MFAHCTGSLLKHVAQFAGRVRRYVVHRPAAALASLLFPVNVTR